MLKYFIFKFKFMLEFYYNQIAENYESHFTNPEAETEEKELFDLLQIPSNASVLDIGSGSGMACKYLPTQPYIGIEPSLNMLKLAKLKYPNKTFLHSDFDSFNSNRKFDRIIGLFGVGNYLQERNINKIQKMLNNKGESYIMFYQNVPETYKIFGEPDEAWKTYKTWIEGDTILFKNYVIKKYVK